MHAGRHAEDVAHGVVLLLVELARLDRVETTTPHSVDTHADVLQDRRVVPVDELRADDAGVRPERLLDQLRGPSRVERHVVVQEAEEARALDELQRLVGRRPEPRVVVEGGRMARRASSGRCWAIDPGWPPCRGRARERFG